mmetsp:Transcript_5622/g.9696  ORF Transcript_5622/g.9696 Transcript_5622/m.9696 type:complete len:114 (-) Transcript_5622:661-1002(-)
MQSINNQFRGMINIRVQMIERGTQQFIQVDIENSKFEVKAKELQRLGKLANEKQFSKILEAKVDLNFKISKILSNALGWEIDFNSFRSGKQTLIIPATKDSTIQHENLNDQQP